MGNLWEIQLSSWKINSFLITLKMTKNQYKNCPSSDQSDTLWSQYHLSLDDIERHYNFVCINHAQHLLDHLPEVSITRCCLIKSLELWTLLKTGTNLKLLCKNQEFHFVFFRKMKNRNPHTVSFHHSHWLHAWCQWILM